MESRVSIIQNRKQIRGTIVDELNQRKKNQQMKLKWKDLANSLANKYSPVKFDYAAFHN